MDFIGSSSTYNYGAAAVMPATSTLSGTVNGIIDDNDFFLGTGSGNVVIDMGSISLSQIGLAPGEVVSVGVREFDDADVDAATLTRANGSIVQVPPGNDYSPPPVTDPLTGTNFSSLQVPAVVPGQTVTGTVESIVDDDDFILNYGFGRSLVDLGSLSIRQTGLTPGESISITVREADSEDIDAASITRSNGFTVQVPPESRGSSEPRINPFAGTNFSSLQVPAVVPGQTVTGTVESIVDDDDFILNYGFGRSLVDLGPVSIRQTGLTPGESISITVREADSEDIDAASITRSNGFTVQVPRESDDFNSGSNLDDWDDNYQDDNYQDDDYRDDDYRDDNYRDDDYRDDDYRDDNYRDDNDWGDD